MLWLVEGCWLCVENFFGMLQTAYLVVVCLDKGIIMYLPNQLANKSCPLSRSFQKIWEFDALCGPGPRLMFKNEDSSVDICVCLRRTPFAELLQTVNTYWILMSCGWGQPLRNSSLKNENSVLVSFKACISSLDHGRRISFKDSLAHTVSGIWAEAFKLYRG